MKGPLSKRPMYLTLNGGDNKCLATSKADKRAGEENSENTETKVPLLRYTNQSSTMTVTGQ